MLLVRRLASTFRTPLFSVLKNVLKAYNISYSQNKTPTLCTACQLGKQSKLRFQSSDFIYRIPLELVHADLWGPAPCLSLMGFCCYICFTDHATRYSWLYHLHTKSEALQSFMTFKTMVELQLRTQISRLQTDGGVST